MRPTTSIKFKRISVTENIHERLKKDRDDFEKVIGGGKWSISDTIEEYLKIIYTFMSQEKDRQKKKNKKKVKKKVETK